MQVTEANTYPLHLLRQHALQLAVDVDRSSNQRTRLLIALDNSGSMSGVPLRNAKVAVQQLLTSIDRPQSVDVVVFNSTAQNTELTKSTSKGIDFFLDSVRATGMTSFYSLFNEIARVIRHNSQKNAKSDLCLVFFTDGCDTCGLQNKASQIADLQKVVRNQSQDSQVHAVGYSPGHDASLLSTLCLIGSVQGSFQYIEESSDISKCMEGIAMSMTSATNVQLIGMNGVHQEVLRRGLRLSSENDKQMRGTIFISDSDWSRAESWHLKIDESLHPFTPQSGKRNGFDHGCLVLESVSQEVIILAEKIAAGLSKQQLTDILEKQLPLLAEMISTVRSTIKDLTVACRKVMKGKIMQTETLINRFHSEYLSSALTKTLTNAKIAGLTSLAYRNINKASLRKQLDKRAEANVAAYERHDSQIQDIVNQLDFASLESSQEDYGRCVITCMNYTEALQDGDCFCIGLDISRPEAAIADPSRLVIKNVYNTVVTADSFLEAVKFRLSDSGPVISVDWDQSVHGGFGRGKTAKVLPGQANENITGVLPIFINESHWKIASLNCKAVFGWMCTLDVMGASYSQVKIVPFLVLARVVSQAAEDPKEYLYKLREVVLDTCLAVYKQSPSIREEMMDEGSVKFLKGPENRTIDVVPNLSVFLAQLICATMIGDVHLTSSNCQELYLAMIEEGFRRQAAFSSKPDDNAFLKPQDIMQLLGINPLKHIDPYVEEVRTRIKTRCSSRLPDYRQKFLAMLPEVEKTVVSPKQQRVTGENRAKSTLQPQDKLVRGHVNKTTWDRIAETARKWYEQAIDVSLFQFAVAQNSVVFAPIKWDNWPLDVQMTLSMQSLWTVKNSTRRQLVSDGLYLDPFQHSSAFLDRHFHKEVKAKIDSGIEAVTKAYQDNKFAQVAEEFLKTDDLDFAAGAFFGNTVGVSLPFFYKPMLQRVFPFSVEKMRMIVTGHFRGVRLFRDAANWQIGRRNTIGFLRLHHHIIGIEDAVTMFPRHERNIRLWYQIYEW